MNAYTAAGCGSNVHQINIDDDHDDYFSLFYSFGGRFQCCQSLKAHYAEYCMLNEYITDVRLLLVIMALLLCEGAKSLIKKHELHFLPEAGACILVGTFCEFIANLVPDIDLEYISFDEDLFLCVLLPPIIFDAALSVNKTEFRKRKLPILMFAIIGTLFSTFTTGYMIHYASTWISNAPTITSLDSLVFGALISSIDPVAILSVLKSLNVSETDTIFILVFGESLLNDGIAITLFKALAAHYSSGNENLGADDILGYFADFLILVFGSICVGLASGVFSLVYFWTLHDILNPAMEVASFFCGLLSPITWAMVLNGLEL